MIRHWSFLLAPPPSITVLMELIWKGYLSWSNPLLAVSTHEPGGQAKHPVKTFARSGSCTALYECPLLLNPPLRISTHTHTTHTHTHTHTHHLPAQAMCSHSRSPPCTARNATNGEAHTRRLQGSTVPMVWKKHHLMPSPKISRCFNPIHYLIPSPTISRCFISFDSKSTISSHIHYLISSHTHTSLDSKSDIEMFLSHIP